MYLLLLEIWISGRLCSLDHIISSQKWFSSGCRKTNTKEITLTNHNSSKQHDEPVHIVCFQKISRPLPRRELEIPEERGGWWPRKFWRGEGFWGQIHFQMVGKIIDFSWIRIDSEVSLSSFCASFGSLTWTKYVFLYCSAVKKRFSLT